MKYDVTFTEQAENAAGQLDRIEEKILSLGEQTSVPRFLYPAKGYGIISLTLKLS